MSRRYAPARRVNPQFANSPRFLLSQTAEDNDLDIVDDDEPSSAAPKPFTPAHTPQIKNIPRRQRDVIEDSDDELHGDDTHSPVHPQITTIPQQTRDIIEDTDDGELLPRDGVAQGNDTTELADDAIHSTPPDELFTPKLQVIEEDAPFQSTQDGTKRQRLSTGDEQSSAQRHTAELSVYKRPTIPIHSTPGPSSATPFRTKPRFMLSAKQPSSVQPVFRAETPAPHATPQPERRKLTFVLPRSPSPLAVDENIPAPFSPSSRTLRRRRRCRSGAPVYTPGGMAAEVRSWILEMGSKHEPMATSRVSSKPRDDPSRYHLSARVISARQDVRASGAVSFIRAEAESAGEKKVVNMMAMGQSGRQLQPRNLVGIHPGLTWTVDLGLSAPLGNDGSDRGWLVAMEWDLLDEKTA